MPFQIEDLGVAGVGEANLDGGGFYLVRHPATGAEYAILPTLEHSFLVIDPRRRNAVHVLPDMSLYQRMSRFTAQGPDGALYSIGFHKGQCFSPRPTCSLLKWDWKAELMQPCFDLEKPHDTCLNMDFDTDGRLFLQWQGRLTELDLTTRRETLVLEPVGQFVCGWDEPWLYLIKNQAVWALETRTNVLQPLMLPDGRICPVERLQRDGAGRVIIRAVVGQRASGVDWIELKGGQAQPVAAGKVRLTETLITNLEIGQAEPWMTYWTPFVFADGSYISRVIGIEATLVDTSGLWHTFTMDRKVQPLQLFAMVAGGGRLWMGTVLPLHLLSYDLSAGKFANYGTPTPVPGEIYNMVWSGERLFMASYPGAGVTRYDPGRPWRFDRSDQANPRQLGRIKESGPALHRTHGRAQDPAGNVYFAAKGDYGCVDSGIARIDIATETMSRWIYPNTTMTALTYLPQTGQLLVCERRMGESCLRGSFVAADTGAIAESLPLIQDDGDIIAWLHDGGDLIYGLHDYRATIFAFSLKERRIVRKIEELHFGEHCKNSLIFGPDQRLWGVTHECVFAVDRELRAKERLAAYEDRMLIRHSRFGLEFGPDGHLYFMNGAHLMRLIVK
ncbi:MAG: hypothetical protein HYV35_10395 [Lentisphaerae bacterium]|nr:hypothetical protein [Lentisphaerota bacterium]